jgi:TldD protein
MNARYAAPFGPSVNGANGANSADGARGDSRPSVIDPDSARRLLSQALARGGHYADLFFEYHVSASYAYDEGILKSVGRGVTLGLGVRVLHGDATGYAYVEDLSWESMLHAATIAGQIAATGKNVEPVGLTTRQGANRYPVQELSLDVGGAEKKSLLERADKAARAVSPKIVRVDASLSEELREILIATSDGIWVYDRQPLLRFGLRTIAESGSKRESGSSGGGGRVGLEYFEGKSPEWHAQAAAEQSLTMLDAREAPAGEFPVVLAPGDSGILLHEAVGHGLEADFNRKKTSNYTDQIGREVASSLCTVVDDATLAFSRGAINIDDEGNEPTSSVLIEGGVLRGYMHDRQSASFFRTHATGNGRRESFRSHPMPRMTNTLLLAGADDPSDIIKSVQHGVYAKKFGGGQVDISNGDFVFSLTESYLIENGVITAPLKGVNLIGNGPDVMRKVSMLGHDMQVSDGIWTCGKDGQSVPVGVGCPTLKLDRVTVGGTQLSSSARGTP